MFRVASFVMLLLAALAGIASAKCPPPVLQTFSDAIDERGHLRIPLVINGHTVQAIVCTDCWASELGEKFVERAGLSKRPRVNGGYTEDYDGNKTEFITERLQIKFGDIPFRIGRYFAIDAGSGDVAVVGTDLIQYFDLEVDPVQRSLTLHGWNSCRRPEAEWARQAAELPFTLRDGYLYAYIDMNGQKVEASIATGNPVTMMDFRHAKRHFGVTPQSPGVRKTGTMSFAGSDTQHDLYEYTLSELNISGLTLHNVPLKLVDVDDYGVSLGMHELNQLHFYLAFGSKRIYAAPSAGR